MRIFIDDLTLYWGNHLTHISEITTFTNFPWYNKLDNKIERFNNRMLYIMLHKCLSQTIPRAELRDDIWYSFNDGGDKTVLKLSNIC